MKRARPANKKKPVKAARKSAVHSPKNNLSWAFSPLNIQSLLQESRLQQQAILESIPDMAWLKDKESRFIAVNEAFGKACGVSPKDLVGKTDLDIWPKDLAERYRADDREVMKTGSRKCVEEPLADKEGRIQWIETIKTPVYNEKGEVIGTSGIARDITARRKIEEQLRESEERYRTLVENLNIGVYRNTAGPEGRFLEANTAHCRMYGYDSFEEFKKVTVAQLYAKPQERQLFIEKIKRQGFVKNEELLLRKKDGTLFWGSVTAKAHFGPDGEIAWIDGIIDDVTERKQLEERVKDARHELEIKVKVRTAELTKANEDLRKYISERRQFEEALQESEARYRLTIDALGQPIHVVDRDFRVLLSNAVLRQWNERLGFSPEVVGKTIFEIYPFLPQRVAEEYEKVFESGKPLLTEETNTVAGKEIITETRKIPVFEKGKVTRVVTVIEDITARKRLEYVLRESEERYKRIAEAITDYIFTVIIDNGKPVKTIYGPTCLAVTGYSPEEFKADPYLWIKMVHEDDRRIVQEATSLILSGEKAQSFEHRIVRKDGAVRWIRNTSVSHFDEKGNLLSYDGLIQDITERKVMEKRLEKINACFTKLGVDPLENIRRLVALCGEMLGADCAMYNRIGEGIVSGVAQWNYPEEPLATRKSEGALCAEVVRQNSADLLVIRNLPKSNFAKSDPAVLKYNLQTYAGYPVRLDSKNIGSLCVFYKKDFLPDVEDKKVFGIISSAIGVEEERRNIRTILEKRIRFEEIVTSISANFIKITPAEVDKEIRRALQILGEFAGVERSYIFLASKDQTKADIAYEWCAAGVPSQFEYMKGLSAKSFPWFTEKIKKAEVISINCMSDFPPEAAAEKVFIETQGIQSIILVPMVYGKSIIGFLGFDSLKREIIWSQEDITLLRTVGEVFSNALEHKYADEAIRSGERFLTSVFTSIQDGISILDKEFHILRVNPTMEQWYAHYMPLVGKRCYEAYHNRKEPCKICPSCRTIKSGEAAYDVVPKIGAGGQVVGWLDLYSFPLFDSLTGELTGVIEYVRDITERKRAEQKLEILNKELIKSNKRLKQLVLRDSHTGLYNHRYLEEVIEAEFYRARRYAHPLSVIMLDVDYFKSINDVYGHQFGDLALKQLAGHLKKMVRRYDIIVRFGGEEFVIIFPGTDRATTLVLGQRILDSMTTHSFGNKEHTVKLKLSVAVASYPEDKIARGMDLVEVADQVLNKVKEFGGNRVYSSLDIREKKGAPAVKDEGSASAKFLQEKLEKLNKRANQSLIEAVFAFAKTIEVKDHYTGEHVESTVHYATEIANALKLPKYEIELIKQASMLHDLGKIGISEKILLKSSKLEKKEFEEIKKHPQIGVDIIRPIQFFHNIIPLMLYHHERWDGKGYPRGLKGEEIPIGARIIAIADVYQALTSHRPYRKKAYSKEDAIRIIKEGSGTQFDPKIVEVFLEILKKED